MSATPSFPDLTAFRKPLCLPRAKCALGDRLPSRLLLAATEAVLPAFPTLSADPVTGTVGRRPSGARLYHRGSRFGPPERRKLDRNLIARIMFLAEALERRTRMKGQHGGVLKAKGLDVLRALLRRFYCHATGECYPSFAAIAEAAGCCEATAKAKVRILAALGILDVIRRKVVESFTSTVHRVRYDVSVQTSNSYVFNFALSDRAEHGDLALPLLRPREAGSKIQPETSSTIKNTLPPELAAALERLGHAIDGTAGAR